MAAYNNGERESERIDGDRECASRQKRKERERETEKKRDDDETMREIWKSG